MRVSELHRINKATLNEQGDPADHFKEQADMLLKSAELPVPILEKIVEMIVTREFWCPN